MSRTTLLSSTGLSPKITGVVNGVNRVFTTSINAAAAPYPMVYVDTGRDFDAVWSGTTLTTGSPPIGSVRIEFFGSSEIEALGSVLYVDPGDLSGSLPDDWAAQFTNDGNGGSDVKLLMACKDASNWIDGFLARFSPPMEIGRNASQVTLDCLRPHAIIRAKYEILGRKVGPEGYRNIDQGFSSTERFLLAVQKGAALPGAALPAIETDAPDVAGSVTPGEIVFGDDSAVF